MSSETINPYDDPIGRFAGLKDAYDEGYSAALKNVNEIIRKLDDGYRDYEDLKCEMDKLCL